jgi:hypothetical protein
MSSNPSLPWADSDTLVSADSLLWKQYTMYADLFRFYVDIAWRACVWFYAITGVLTAFYLDHVGHDRPYLSYALLLPVAFSGGFSVLFLRGAHQVSDMRIKLDYIRDQLNLPGRPHVEFLYDFLRLGAALFALVGVAVVTLLVIGVIAYG